MNGFWLATLIVLAFVNLVLSGVLFRRRPRLDPELLRPQLDSLAGEVRRIDNALREEFRGQREETGKAAGGLREEVSTRINTGLESLLKRQGEAQQAVEGRLESFRSGLEKVNETVTQQLEKIRGTVEARLGDLQTKNEQKLEEMRRTVDEKLEATLERRLGESFKLVSERLEQVHKGLGEMQAMASSVGDLKRVLSNVKIRGTWGEIQLGALLEQMLTPDQYSANVAPKPESGERVEFAIRLPGSNGEDPVWLPIDAKFPQEDYQRLLEATERADSDGVLEAGKALELCFRNQARAIHEKYIAPPHTTDFAIQFLPSEALYAEALRRPGLADNLQREFRVMIAGPSILAALLNCLQMGFRTLAIEQRSSEVWRVLSAVKTEFGKFGEVISKVKKKLEEASNHIDQTEVRSRAIGRKLREVEALPADEAARLLPDSLMSNDSSDENTPDEPPVLRSLGSGLSA